MMSMVCHMHAYDMLSCFVLKENDIKWEKDIQKIILFGSGATYAVTHVEVTEAFAVVFSQIIL